MQEYMDYLGGDPLAVLRAAQEKLRQEEEDKKRFQEILMRKADPGRYEELNTRMSETPENKALQEAISRVRQKTPLDQMAQTITPEDIERKMYERIWGAPAKSKIGKVGKGISEVLGMFSGLPKDFSKPAMDQFLKIQEQYRKERANDLNAITTAANTIQRAGAAQNKNLVDIQKLVSGNEQQVLKFFNEKLNTEATAKLKGSMAKYYESLPANKKEELRLQGEAIKQRAMSNPLGFANELSQMGPEEQAKNLMLLDQVTTLIGANRGGSTGTGSSSISTTIRREPDETGAMRDVPITTTRQSVPNSGANVMQQRAQGLREQLAQRLGMPAPIASQTAPITPSTGLPKQAIIKSSENKPNLNLSSDVFRLENESAPKTFNAAGAEKKKAARTAMVAYNDLVTRIVRGAESGKLEKITGMKNQPIAAATRMLHDWKFTGKDLGEGLNPSVRRMAGSYANDPEAQNLFEDITNNRVDILANKVLEMSGKAATDQERAFLSIPTPHITDDPKVLLQQTVRKALRMSMIMRLDDLGLRSENPEYYSLINELGLKTDEITNQVVNETGRRAGIRAATNKNVPKFSLDEINPDKLIYATLKEKGLLDKLPGLRLRRSTPQKATEQFKIKLGDISREKRLKALGF